MENSSTVSLYVVKSTANNKYFAGFDAAKGAANFVNEPINGKMFSNKYSIKLRPDEVVVELTIDLSKVQDLKISEPFRPHRRSLVR